MPEENILEKGEQKVESLIKSQPTYVWIGGAVAAGLILFYIIRRRQAAANAASTSGTQSGSALTDAAQLNGFQVDQMAGLPYGTDATGYNYQSGPVDNFPGGSYSEVGVNGNNVPIVPSGVNPIYDSNGNLVGFQQPGQPTTSPAPAPTQTPAPTPTPAQTETGTIRARQTSGVTSTYDKPNPGGVPFRATPGGTVLHTVPYGSQVTIAGTPVQGPDNFGKADTTHAGSSLWFPVTVGSTKGYVSAYDIINVLTGSATGQGSGGDAGGFHLPINAGRNTMDQWTFSNGMHQDFHSFAGLGLD